MRNRLKELDFCFLCEHSEETAQIPDGQPAQIREVFRYALAVRLVEDGKATRHSDGASSSSAGSTRGNDVYILTSGHGLFSALEPEVGEDVLPQWREMAREAVRDDGAE